MSFSVLHWKLQPANCTHTSLWVVLGDAGLGEVVNDLLFKDFGVIDEQLGALIHQVLRNVDTGRLPGVTQHTCTHEHLDVSSNRGYSSQMHIRAVSSDSAGFVCTKSKPRV